MVLKSFSRKSPVGANHQRLIDLTGEADNSLLFHFVLVFFWSFHLEKYIVNSVVVSAYLRWVQCRILPLLCSLFTGLKSWEPLLYLSWRCLSAQFTSGWACNKADLRTLILYSNPSHGHFTRFQQVFTDWESQRCCSGNDRWRRLQWPTKSTKMEVDTFDNQASLGVVTYSNPTNPVPPQIRRNPPHCINLLHLINQQPVYQITCNWKS